MNTPRRHHPERRPADAAYSLPEVLIAALLFAIVCLAGYLGLVQGFKIIQTTRENLRATQILQDKTEIVRLYTWDQLTNSGFMPLTFTDYFNPQGESNNTQGVTFYGTVLVTNAPLTDSYAGDLKMVTFQVNWTNDNLPHQRQITTLVSRYGIHNYIYGPN